MTLTSFTNNWSGFVTRLQHRFPHVDADSLSEPISDSSELTRHLAKRHDLTLLEAREELEDFLGLEALTAQAQELHPAS